MKPLPTILSKRQTPTGNPNADGLSRASPAERGISEEAISAFLEECERLGVEMNSFMLWRSGAVVAEGWWWPYAPTRRHMMHSATKSFLSAAVGLAIAEGRFSLGDRVLSFFPEHCPAVVPEYLGAMTVEDLLTQTSGHANGTSGAQWRSIPTSWIAEFLKIAIPFPPGERFRYSSATSFMLSAIITKTTGDNVHAYLKPRLLDPLGIDDFTWDVGPENINPGGNGASCRTADLLKLAILHLQKGRWEGRQVLSSEWVARATSQHRGNPYGYHWWIGPGGSFYAYGVFGQFAFVFPDHDTILVTTAAVPYGEETLRSLVWHHFPEILNKPVASGAVSDDGAFDPRGLALLRPLARTHSTLEAAITGVVYRAETNADGIDWFSLTFDRGLCRLEISDSKGIHVVSIGLDDWCEGDTSISGAALHHGYEPPAMRVVAGGRWTERTAFEVTLQFVETAFRDRLRFRFSGDGGSITLERDVNTNSASPVRPAVHAIHAAVPS